MREGGGQEQGLLHDCIMMSSGCEGARERSDCVVGPKKEEAADAAVTPCTAARRRPARTSRQFDRLVREQKRERTSEQQVLHFDDDSCCCRHSCLCPLLCLSAFLSVIATAFPSLTPRRGHQRKEQSSKKMMDTKRT